MVLCNISYAQVVGTQPSANATYTQSQNLLNPTVNSWVGTVQGQNGGFSGGTTPAFNPTTNTIIFGYMMASATQTIALNSALASAGVGLKVGGYSYSWNINNDPSSGQYGSLTGRVSLKDAAGNSLQTYNYNYPQLMGAGFVSYSGTQWFPQDYSLTNTYNLELSFTGKDQTFWAGYYGPQVRNPSLSALYTPDLCVSNPLSDPNCPGYAAALLNQQCTANPLFNPSCPGYTIAMCSSNPLFSQSCPGYAAAYLTQQCSINPLYDKNCPGYATALQNQQCETNPLSSTSCSGYAEAYLAQQCASDGLYSTQCPNYAEAYAKKNILGISTTTTSSLSASSNKVSVTEPTVTVSSSGKVETSVSKTGDSVVDSVLETKATSAAPDATATVKLSEPNVAKSETINSQAAVKSETKSETKTTAKAETSTRQSQSDKKEDNKQSSKEQKQTAIEKAKSELKKAETANSFEGQVAVQRNVIEAMSFVPGFSSYAQSNIPDVLGRQLQKQYGRDVVDNRNVGRRLFGGSDRLHEEMVNEQYRKRD